MTENGSSEHQGPVPGAEPPLISQVSQAAFWNAVLLPVLGGLNLAFAVLIRRRFGLFSGVYDVLMGLTQTLVRHSSLGVATALLKFLPEVRARSGSRAPRRLLRDAVLVRLALLTLLIVPLNLLADPVARILELGPSGPFLIRLVSLLAVARSILDMMVRTLNAFFAQMWSNLLALFQTALELAVVGSVLALGYEMGGVFGSLVATGIAAALLGVGSAFSRLRGPDQIGEMTASEADASRRWFAGEAARFFRFSAFTYVFNLSGYFAGMGFMAPALAIVLSTDEVALYATAYKLSFMTISLVVASFRGVYRPLFARVRIRDDRPQLQRTFVVVSKVQLVVLIPAALGLIVMSGDYVPLLFGPEFLPAVPLAWVLVGFMYATSAFNLPGIVLSVDEQFRAIAWLRAPSLVAVPVVLLAAYLGGLAWAACVFGVSSLVVELITYRFCRRVYGFQFPWRFGARVTLVSLVMAAVLATARTMWPTSVVEAVTLTVVGASVVLVGMRVNRVLGPDELGLLSRTGLPGHTWLVAWFAPTARDRFVSGDGR